MKLNRVYQRCEQSTNDRDRPSAQIGGNAVRAGKARKGDGVQALTGKGAVAHAVQVRDCRAIEGHSQQSWKLSLGHGAVGAVYST